MHQAKEKVHILTLYIRIGYNLFIWYKFIFKVNMTFTIAYLKEYFAIRPFNITWVYPSISL